MRGKPRLFLLDAGPVIELHGLGLWRKVVESAEVVLGGTIAKESRYYKVGDGTSWGIDLRPDLTSGHVRILDADAAALTRTAAVFDAETVQRVDAGELEALTLLREWSEGALRPLFCSGDKRAVIAACLLGFAEGILALEDVLHNLGIGRPAAMKNKFRRRVLAEWIAQGKLDRLEGRGLR